jgi:UDP-3-O-[3-hydroxymyristoyl] glucosamine N-acyltransferase
MTMPLADVADLIAGQLVGNGAILIHGAATIACARPGDITLADHARLVPQLARSQAAAVIVGRNFTPTGIPYVIVDDVHAAFAALVQHFRPQRLARTVGISPAAQISATARLSEHVQVHPLATVGEDVEIGPRTIIHSGVRLGDGCKIGADVSIFPNAALYENTIVGNRVLIHAGAVLGAYGFGYTLVGGQHKLTHQLGYVEIGDDVEIGAATAIDRGTYGPTIIGQGTKIDNQVQIGHNCRIGKHNLICSQVGIAGSTTTGDYVVMGGQVGVRDHVHIGDGAMLGAQCGIMKEVPAGHRVVGSPAIDEREQYHVWAATFKLPAMRKQLHDLERRIEELTQQVGRSGGQRGEAA